MTDTPQHIKDLQLQIWLSRTPAERLRQLMMDNDAIFNLWNSMKRNNKNTDPPSQNKTQGEKNVQRAQ